MRLPDWETRLDRVIRAAAKKRFAWGDFDCCTFAADCILAMTGFDPLADLRGKYATKEQAKAVLAWIGPGGLLGAICRAATQHHWIETLPIMAKRGDLMLAKIDRQLALGVCLDDRAVFPGQGLTPIPITECWRALKV